MPYLFDGGPIVQPLPEATTFFKNGSFEIAATRLDLEPEAVRASAALLSDAERQQASRFAFDSDCCRFTVARARLRQLLAARLGVRPKSVELTYSACGKPVFASRFAESNLRFNVSHSEDLAVYALSHGREIGVDIERVQAISDADDIAARFFSRRENEAYCSLDPHDKPLAFLNCWTRKEAFIKALGSGLQYPLDRFDVSVVPGEPARILRVGSSPGDACGWDLHSFSPGPGYVGAVVVQKYEYDSTS